jgi:hypothetical protein
MNAGIMESLNVASGVRSWALREAISTGEYICILSYNSSQDPGSQLNIFQNTGEVSTAVAELKYREKVRQYQNM